MENKYFGYQDYRDDLAEKLKVEPDKDERKEKLEKEKKAPKYMASKLLRDESRSERMTEAKDKKEKIAQENFKTIETLEEEVVVDFQKKIYDLNSSLKEEQKKGNAKLLKNVFSNMEKSVDILKLFITFFKEHMEEINKKGFRIKIDINDISYKYKKPYLADVPGGYTGHSPILGGVYHPGSDEGNAGRIRLDIEGPKNVNFVKSEKYFENATIFDLPFPVETSPYSGKIDHKVKEFLSDIEKDLVNTPEEIPVHKL